MTARLRLPLSGVLFVALALVAVVGFGGDTPDTGASADEVLAFYRDHTGRQAAAAFLLAAAVPFLVLFAASLATGIWHPADGDRPVWRYVLLVGAGVFAASILVMAMVHFTLVDAADNGVSPATAQGLNFMDSDFWIAMNAGFGVMMVGAAGWLLCSSGAPRWLGWSALVLGVLLFVPFADFPALLLSLVWIVVVSVVLFLRTRAMDDRRAPTARSAIA